MRFLNKVFHPRTFWGRPPVRLGSGKTLKVSAFYWYHSGRQGGTMQLQTVDLRNFVKVQTLSVRAGGPRNFNMKRCIEQIKRLQMRIHGLH